MRHHTLIAGTGRAGTSVLVRVLDACGLETELSMKGNQPFWDENANAGLEHIPVAGHDYPYVLKSPWSYQFLDELLTRKNITLDYAIVPIRDLAEATASRVTLELQNRYEHNYANALDLDETWQDWGMVPGGLTYSLAPIDQARILSHAFHRTIEVLSRHEVPIRFLSFPRFVDDPEYLFRSLDGVLPKDMSLSDFKMRTQSMLDPKKARSGGELSAESSPKHATAPQDGPRVPGPEDLPAFETLDRIALKRTLKSTQAKLAKSNAQVADLQRRLSQLEDAAPATRLGKKIRSTTSSLLKKVVGGRAHRDAFVSHR